MYCRNCGKEINDNTVICINCGCAVDGNANKSSLNIKSNTSSENDKKDWIATLLLAWFTGIFGIHRFYLGHIGIGLGQLFTLGGCGIWAFIDWILVCFNKIKDANGNELKNYNETTGMVLFAVGIGLTVIGIVGNIILIAIGDT